MDPSSLYKVHMLSCLLVRLWCWCWRHINVSSEVVFVGSCEKYQIVQIKRSDPDPCLTITVAVFSDIDWQQCVEIFYLLTHIDGL
jgi:hypothetical protein